MVKTLTASNSTGMSSLTTAAFQSSMWMEGSSRPSTWWPSTPRTQRPGQVALEHLLNRKVYIYLGEGELISLSVLEGVRGSSLIDWGGYRCLDGCRMQWWVYRLCPGK